MISSLLAAGLVAASGTPALANNLNNFWTPPTTIEGGTTFPTDTGAYPIEWPSEITYSLNNIPKENTMGWTLVQNDFLPATALKHTTQPDVRNIWIAPGYFYLYDQQGNAWEGKHVGDLKQKVTHFTLKFSYLVYYTTPWPPSRCTLPHPISLTIIRDQSK